jgi:hypothetical protein
LSNWFINSLFYCLKSPRTRVNVWIWLKWSDKFDFDENDGQSTKIRREDSKVTFQSRTGERSLLLRYCLPIFPNNQQSFVEIQIAWLYSDNQIILFVCLDHDGKNLFVGFFDESLIVNASKLRASVSHLKFERKWINNRWSSSM